LAREFQQLARASSRATFLILRISPAAVLIPGNGRLAARTATDVAPAVRQAEID
jgi:hypothetical protein